MYHSSLPLAYKIVTALDELKRRQMDKKKLLRRRQQSVSQHLKPSEDDSLQQIRRNYYQKIKAFPKLDCYQRLKGYLQLQDLEIKRVRNNSNQPTYGTLYPQNDEDNRLSSFLVGESPMRRNYGNNRYQSESPARLIQDQAIPELRDFLKDRKVRKIVQATQQKKEVPLSKLSRKSSSRSRNSRTRSSSSMNSTPTPACTPSPRSSRTRCTASFRRSTTPRSACAECTLPSPK